MMLTPLDQHDPRLRQLCAPVTKAMLRDRQQQLEIEALLDFVHGAVNKTQHGTRRNPNRPNTVGLAGNQVGIMKQICAVDLSIGRQGYTDFYVLVNPTITWRSRALVSKSEGCVNFPTVWGATTRSSSVRVSGMDRSGNEIELKLTGWPAVLIQHEIDHLKGHLFVDRMLDPSHAHLVQREDFPRYKRNRSTWDKFVDVSDLAASVHLEG